MTFCPTAHIRFGGDQLKEKQSKFREMLGTTVKCGYLLHYKSIKSDKSNSEPKYISIFRESCWEKLDRKNCGALFG